MDVANLGTVAVRAEERYRVGNDVHAAETEIKPQLKYEAIWANGTGHAVAIYEPRFIYTNTSDRTLPDPKQVNPGTYSLDDPNDKPISFLHSGGLGLELIKPRWRLSAYQFGAYGEVTTTALLVAAPWGGEGMPADPVPIIPSTVATRFLLLFAQTQITAPIRLTPRLALIPFVTYNAFGGADSKARAAMALTKGPGASLGLDWQATKSDRFLTTVGGGETDTQFEGDRAGATILRAEATEAWTHYYDSHLSSVVSGGVQLGGDNIYGFSFYGLVSASMVYDTWITPRIAPGAPIIGAEAGKGNHLQVGMGVKATPWLDIFSGSLEQRAVGTFAVNYTIDRTTLRGGLAGGKVFNTPESVAKYSIFTVDGGFRYAFAQTVAMDAGIRYGTQDFSNAIRFSDISQVSFFAGLSFNPLPARF